MQAEDMATNGEAKPWPNRAAPQPVNDGDLVARLGMDAQKWATEFGTRFHGSFVFLRPPSPHLTVIDKADLIGWFANAIMAGYDRGREQGEKEERERATATTVKPPLEAPKERVQMYGAKRPEGHHRLYDSEKGEFVDVPVFPVKKMATLLIPRIDNDGHDLAAQHAALQVELIGLFGGYTATAATGGWRDGLTIYRDELTRYDVAVKAFDTTVERDLQRVAERMARACHQDCIMLVLPDGQAICVDAAGGAR